MIGTCCEGHRRSVAGTFPYRAVHGIPPLLVVQELNVEIEIGRKFHRTRPKEHSISVIHTSDKVMVSDKFARA